MISNGIKTSETAGAFSSNVENLLAQLNTEGKELAIEYMEYLVPTGKYPAEDYREPGCMSVIKGLIMA